MDRRDEIAELRLQDIVPPFALLRPVRKDTVEWLEMVDSIREHGLMNSISVRPHPRRQGVYEVIDGMWRFSVCQHLDWEKMPVIIKHGCTDEELIALQISCNSVSYETKPLEFARHMNRLLSLRQSVGVPFRLKDMAALVGKSTSWVSSRLMLLNLEESIQELVSKGELCLGKATVLARLKSYQWQLHFLKHAVRLNSRDFEQRVGKFIARLRQKTNRIRYEYDQKIELRPRLRSMDEMLMELDSMRSISTIIVQNSLQTPLQGARAMLEWVLNLDKAGRSGQVKEAKFRLTDTERRKIIGRQRYEELLEIRKLREQRMQEQYVSLSNQESGEMKNE